MKLSFHEKCFHTSLFLGYLMVNGLARLLESANLKQRDDCTLYVDGNMTVPFFNTYFSANLSALIAELDRVCFQFFQVVILLEHERKMFWS